MNIFNWAQDNNIIWLENIDWWLRNHIARPAYIFLRCSNGLSQKRAENICRKMFNHVGISPMNRLSRLIGFGDDGEDFYYIIKELNGNIVFSSMVADFCSIKGKISNWSYNNINKSISINGCPEEKDFWIKINLVDKS